MERGNLLLANYISIGLSFGFFTMMIKNLALPDPWTPSRGKEYCPQTFAAQAL
jgi:hypothetical protein